MPPSRWKFVLLWQVTGMLCALGVSAIDAFIRNVRLGAGTIASVRSVPNDIAFVVAGVVLVTPLSLLVFWSWVQARGRYPNLEPSFGRGIVHLSLAAVLLAILAGAISNWELVGGDSDVATLLKGSLSVARSVLFWCVLGVVLPRILVRPLRPPPAAPRIAA